MKFEQPETKSQNTQDAEVEALLACFPATYGVRLVCCDRAKKM